MFEIDTPEAMHELRREAIKKIRYWVDVANAKMNLNLAYPQVLFALQGMTAGTANAGTNVIKLNPTLLRENPETFLEQTCGHEVGHLAARFRHRGQSIDPHGIEWQRVMWSLGLPATRCHNYDVTNVPTRATSIPRQGAPRKPAGQFANGRVIELD